MFAQVVTGIAPVAFLALGIALWCRSYDTGRLRWTLLGVLAFLLALFAVLAHSFRWCVA